MSGNHIDRELVDLLSAVFSSHRARLSESRSENTDTTPDLELWAQLRELGLARLTGSERSGGSGADWFAAAELLRAAAHHAVPTPVVEHDLLAGWLLTHAGLPVDDTRRSACILDTSGTARDVGWASSAERVVVGWPSGDAWMVADIDTDYLTIDRGVNLAGEPRDIVGARLDDLTGVEVDAATIRRFRLRGALARSLQTCGALERVLDMTVTHAGQREQFGRPLVRFQAVTSMIADIAAETSLAQSATEAALATAVRSDWADSTLEFSVAVARSCTGRATSVVVRNAHQVHGAIGTTREHQLHEFTLPAVAWRSEFGSVHDWERVVTEAVLAVGADGLWPLIVD